MKLEHKARVPLIGSVCIGKEIKNEPRIFYRACMGHTCSMTKIPYLFGFIANFTASHKIILLFSYRLWISISMFYSRSRQTWIAHKFPELLARQFSVRYHQMRPKNYIISVRLCDVILLLTFFVNIRRSILKLRVLKWLNGNCNWLVFAMANWIRVTGICSMGIGGRGGNPRWEWDNCLQACPINA